MRCESEGLINSIPGKDLDLVYQLIRVRGFEGGLTEYRNRNPSFMSPEKTNEVEAECEHLKVLSPIQQKQTELTERCSNVKSFSSNIKYEDIDPVNREKWEALSRVEQEECIVEWAVFSQDTTKCSELSDSSKIDDCLNRIQQEREP